MDVLKIMQEPWYAKTPEELMFDPVGIQYLTEVVAGQWRPKEYYKDLVKRTDLLLLHKGENPTLVKQKCGKCDGLAAIVICRLNVEGYWMVYGSFLCAKCSEARPVLVEEWRVPLRFSSILRGFTEMNERRKFMEVLKASYGLDPAEVMTREKAFNFFYPDEAGKEKPTQSFLPGFGKVS